MDLLDQASKKEESTVPDLTSLMDSSSTASEEPVQPQSNSAVSTQSQSDDTSAIPVIPVTDIIKEETPISEETQTSPTTEPKESETESIPPTAAESELTDSLLSSNTTPVPSPEAPSEPEPTPPPAKGKPHRPPYAIIAFILLFLVTLPIIGFYIQSRNQLADTRSRAATCSAPYPAVCNYGQYCDDTTGAWVCLPAPTAIPTPRQICAGEVCAGNSSVDNSPTCPTGYGLSGQDEAICFRAPYLACCPAGIHSPTPKPPSPTPGCIANGNGTTDGGLCCSFDAAYIGSMLTCIPVPTPGACSSGSCVAGVSTCPNQMTSSGTCTSGGSLGLCCPAPACTENFCLSNSTNAYCLLPMHAITTGNGVGDPCPPTNRECVCAGSVTSTPGPATPTPTNKPCNFCQGDPFTGICQGTVIGPSNNYCSSVPYCQCNGTNPSSTPVPPTAVPTNPPVNPTNPPNNPTNTPRPPTATPRPPTSTPVPPSSTPVPGICLNIKLYKNNVVLTDLSTLRAGDQVVLSVAGGTNGTGGQFTVNGGTFMPSTGILNQGAASQEFTLPYTIPDGVTDFVIGAQVRISGVWY